MSITNHERPGVYSSYDASSVISGNDGRKTVGLAAVNSAAPAGVPVIITGMEQAVSAFGDSGGEGMTALIRLALRNGAARVAAVPVSGQKNYAQAFAQLGAMDDIQLCLCDSTDLSVQQALRDMVCQASQSRMERLAVIAGRSGESPQELVQRAKALNSERTVLVSGGLTAAAAAAGAIAGERDPALPLGGAVLSGLSGPELRYDDNTLDLLIQGGVTPIERSGGQSAVVRGVTTRTSTDGSPDKSWRDLSTILVVDDVIPGIRAALKSRFPRSKNTAQTRGSIRAQVVLELENKLAREIITAYDNVKVSQSQEDPAVCLVEFSFTTAHGLNQIWLTAHITI
ncbi:MAG: phage tail sheath protein [Lawsonibacter sp.]|nr:phage tail sheath protein [Lawsonibacter sp.]